MNLFRLIARRHASTSRRFHGPAYAPPATGFERLRRSKLIPLLALGTLVAPLVPRVAWADPPAETPPILASAQVGPSTLGAAETSPAGVTGLATANVDPSSGVLRTSIDFVLPTARGAVQPELALQYSSVGPFGVGGRGWSLGIPAIERHNLSGSPQFLNDPFGATDKPGMDRFTFGGEALVEICNIGTDHLCSNANGQNQLAQGEQLPSFVFNEGAGVGWHYYRLQTDHGALMRFFWSDDHTRWVVQDKTGATAEYGIPAAANGFDSSSVDSDSTNGIYRWNLISRYDTQRDAASGAPVNPINYVWTKMTTAGGTTALGYLTDIYDTPRVGDTTQAPQTFAHHTHLAYTQPSWTPSTNANVWNAAPTRVLSRVDVSSQDYGATGERQQVRRYYLTYTSVAAGTTDGPPAVATVQLEGNCTGTSLPNNVEIGGQLPDPSGTGTSACPTRPPTTFTYAPTYQGYQPQGFAMPSLAFGTSKTKGINTPLLFDINGDGLPDLIDATSLPPLVFLNSPTSANAFVPQQLGLAGTAFDLTQVSQIVPGPSLATGAFAMDGHIDMVWSSWGKWQGVDATQITPSLPLCATSPVKQYCDPTLQYSFLSSSLVNNQWTLTPSAGGVFTYGAEFPMGPDLNEPNFTPPAGVHYLAGPEMPWASMDMNGDGIADLLGVLLWGDGLAPVGGYFQYSWRYTIRFSKRSTDGTYWPFYGASASSDTAPQRTDVCVGGLDGPLQNAASTFADVDGDGVPDYIQFDTPSCGMDGSPPRWWRGHGDGVFGKCTTADCPCEAATPEVLYQTPLPSPFANSVAACQAAAGTNKVTPPPYAVHDVTGDGLADIVIGSPGGFDVYVNLGGDPVSFAYPMHVTAPSLTGVPSGTIPSAIYFADMDGSGVDDIIVQETPAGGTAGPTALGYVDLFAGTANAALALRPGLMTGILNGLGLTTSVTYATTETLARQAAANGSPWTLQSPQPLHVVTSITTSDDIGDSYTTSYNYTDPVYDGYTNSFLGFRKVRQTTPGSASILMNTETTYFYGACGSAAQAAPCASGPDNPLASYRALPVLTEIFDGMPSYTTDVPSPTYLSTTHHAYAAEDLYVGIDGGVVRRIFENQVDTFLYDTAPFFALGSSSYALADVDLPGYSPRQVAVRGRGHHLQTQTTLDGYGNIGTVVDKGDLQDTVGGSGGTPDSTVMNLTKWFVPLGTDARNAWTWRPQTVSIGSAPTGVTNRTTTFSYDPYGNVADVTRGLFGTAGLVRPAGGAPTPAGSQNGNVHVAHVAYYPTGNVKTVQVYPSSTSVPRCAEYTYDPPFGQLLTTESADVGDCGSPQAITTSHTFDRVLGVETSTITPGNATYAQTYDGFGRILTVANPDPSTGLALAPSTTFEYYDESYGPLVHMSLVAQPGPSGYPGSDFYEYKDPFGRVIRTVSTADGAKQWVVSGEVARDLRGRVITAYVPHYVTADDGGQVTVPPQAGASFTGTLYDAFSRVIQTTDIDGTPTSKAKYHALSVESRDAEQASGVGPHAAAYALATRDGHGHTVRLDEYGSAGVTSTVATYQATGEVTQVTRSGPDGNGGTLNYARLMGYDTMGRLVTNVEPNTRTVSSSGTAATWIGWTYAYNDLGDLVGTSDARGCGENFAYDGAGRILSEDYSPCVAPPGQELWTAPQSNGDGTEAYYLYEGGSLQTGRLSDVYDRGSHVHYTHDLRGRVTGVEKWLAQPGVPADALSGRYAESSFIAFTGYDERDRAVTQTTGADVKELFSTDPRYAATYGPSEVVGNYSARGTLTSITGSYGPIITGTVVEADGRPDSVTYADAAQTTMFYAYGDARRRLTQTKITRMLPFPEAQGTYVPPVAGSAQPTQEVVLANDELDPLSGRDKVGNPLSVSDVRSPSEWPEGASPVVSRSYVYDDAYRVTNVTTIYPTTAADPYHAPVVQPTAMVSPMPLATGGNRVTKQAFTYDGLGNMLSSTDDAQTFFDRSLGTITQGATTNTLAPGPNQIASATIQTSTSGNKGNLRATYDAAGNMVQLAVQRSGPCSSPTGCNELFQYDWDEVGRLARARRFDFVGGSTCTHGFCHSNPLPVLFSYPALPTTPANADVTYAYDASGARVLRTSSPASGQTTFSAEIFPSLRLNHTTWDGLNYVRTFDTEAVYLTLGGSSYGRVVFNTAAPSINGPQHIFLELTDGLGSTAIVIDRDTSELVERTTYLAYGAVESDYRPDRWQISDGHELESFREEYKFTGKEDDVEIGLTYFGARYYSPQLGRWISPDPLAIHGLGGDLNPYAYVHGRVTTAIDPTGLDDSPDPGTLIGGLGQPAQDSEIDPDSNKRRNAGLGPAPEINGEPAPGLGGTITASPPAPPPPPSAASSPDAQAEANWQAAQDGARNSLLDQAEIAAKALPFIPPLVQAPANVPQMMVLSRALGNALSHKRAPVPTDPTLKDNYDSARTLLMVVQTTVAVVAGGLAAVIQAPKKGVEGIALREGQAAAKGLQAHHIFPRQMVELFEKAGINIEEFRVQLTEGTHLEQLHTPAGIPGVGPGGVWNETWRQYFAAEAAAGRAITAEGLLGQAAKMLGDFKVPYFSPLSGL